MSFKRPSSKPPPVQERDNRQQCVDCKTWSPSTNTNYTLISMQCGWRLVRVQEASGRVVMLWRCPDCWKRHRATGA